MFSVVLDTESSEMPLWYFDCWRECHLQSLLESDVVMIDALVSDQLHNYFFVGQLSNPLFLYCSFEGLIFLVSLFGTQEIEHWWWGLFQVLSVLKLFYLYLLFTCLYILSCLLQTYTTSTLLFCIITSEVSGQTFLMFSPFFCTNILTFFLFVRQIQILLLTATMYMQRVIYLLSVQTLPHICMFLLFFSTRIFPILNLMDVLLFV